MIIDERFLRAVALVAREAGDLIESMRGSQPERTNKPGAGFVTPADLKSEELIVKRLAELAPEATVWAEERGKLGSSAGWQWVIDPLDGTTNFACGLPHYCVSIALTYAGQPQVAVVYAPALNQLFCARIGVGTTRNGMPVRVTDHSIEQSLIVTCMPYQQANDWADSWRNMQAVRRIGGGIRQMGAAALDQAYVSAGLCDAVFFYALGWWDIAAGLLLLREAGAVVTDFDGNPIDSSYASFVAAGPRLHAQLLGLVGKK